MQLETQKRIGKTSRLNGENIAGAAFLFFSFLFIAAGQVNAVFAVLYPADYLLAAIGVVLVVLGYRTWTLENMGSGNDANAKHY